MSNNAAILEFGGIRFNDGKPDADGLRWFGTLSRGGPEPRPYSLPRTGAHGNAYGGGEYGQRHLSFMGQVEGADLDALKVAEMRLMSATNYVGTIGTFVRHDPVPKRLLVHRSDELLFEPESVRVARFALGLTAPDPRWYALAQSASETAGFFQVNAGDLPTYPLVRIAFTGSGSANPVTLTNSTTPKGAQTLSIAQSFVAGDVLVVDFATRRAWKNGADITSSVSGTWWALWPGKNHLSAHQSSLEDVALGTTGWEAQLNSTLRRSSAFAVDGVASLEVAAVAGATNTQARTSSGTSGQAVSATLQYTAIASIRAGSTGRTGTLYIEWFNSSGGALTPSSASFTDTTTGWTQAVVTATAPTGAAFACVTVNFGSSVAAGEKHYVDAVSLHRGSSTLWTPGRANKIDYSTVVGGPIRLEWHDAYA